MGLSSMAGIKKIDEVYRMSGVLLAYEENNQGPVYYDANTEFMNKIANGDVNGAIADLVSGNTSILQAINAMVTHTAGAIIDAATKRLNNGLQSSKVAKKLAGDTAAAMEKQQDLNTIVDEDSEAERSSIANEILRSAINQLGSAIGGSLFNGVGENGALEYLDENVVTYREAFGGFSDIADELNDNWRPRLIFIYYEDTVYIGHFQSFNYTRSAESVDIQYEMQFVIQRKVNEFNYYLIIKI